jgi:hypothetical protein
MVSLGVLGAFAKETLSRLVLVMDAFSRMLSRAMVGGFVLGFRASNINTSSLEVSHLCSQMIHLLCEMQIVNISIIWITFFCALRPFQD